MFVGWSLVFRDGLGQPTENFGHEILEHGRIEGVNLVLAATLNAHQIRQLESREVMRQGRGLQTGRTSQIAGRPLATTQHPKDGAAMGICQGAVCLLHGTSLQQLSKYLNDTPVAYRPSIAGEPLDTMVALWDL